jgi:hypothetical protein
LLAAGVVAGDVLEADEHAVTEQSQQLGFDFGVDGFGAGVSGGAGGVDQALERFGDLGGPGLNAT